MQEFPGDPIEYPGDPAKIYGFICRAQGCVRGGDLSTPPPSLGSELETNLTGVNTCDDDDDDGW